MAAVVSARALARARRANARLKAREERNPASTILMRPEWLRRKRRRPVREEWDLSSFTGMSRI